MNETPHEILAGLLSLPKLSAWVATRGGGFGLIQNPTGCLLVEYLTDAYRKLGIAPEAVYVTTFTAEVRMGGLQARPVRVDLPADFKLLVRTIDSGATGWISRARVLDIIGALEARATAGMDLAAIARRIVPEIPANRDDDGRDLDSYVFGCLEPAEAKA